MMYTVSTRRGASVRVRANSTCDAAVRGATKLGLRWAGRLPTYAAQVADGATMHSVYGPYDPASNAQHHIADVWVA